MTTDNLTTSELAALRAVADLGRAGWNDVGWKKYRELWYQLSEKGLLSNDSNSRMGEFELTTKGRAALADAQPAASGQGFGFPFPTTVEQELDDIDRIHGSVYTTFTRQHIAALESQLAAAVGALENIASKSDPEKPVRLAGEVGESYGRTFGQWEMGKIAREALAKLQAKDGVK